MIHTSKIYHYSNASTIGFLENVISICKTLNQPTTEVSQKMAELSSEIEQLCLIFSTARKNPHTEDLKELDTRRNQLTQGIREIATSYLKHFDADYREAGKSILRTFAKYGKQIEKRKYYDQTEITNSLIRDFENDESLSQAITKLHLSDWLQALKTDNLAFNSLYIIMVMSRVNLPEKNFKESKTIAIARFKSLFNLLKALEMVYPTADYGSIIKEIEELTKKYNVSKPKRGGKE